jgi:osmotically-inducible protein OsmY
MKLGTGAIEIKSGYGLTVEGETADVQNGTVTLRGTIKSRDDLQKLMMALQESNIKNVNNQLTVK